MGRPKRAAASKAKADEDGSPKKAKKELAVGDMLPEFELQNDEEQTVTSADLVKDSGIVLFAYPRTNTKGCTTQAVGLSEKADELAAAGYRVFGISADKPKAQANWRKKEGLRFNLLCDPSHEVLSSLGFMKSAKAVNRSHLVVEKGGKVLDTQYGVTPKNSIKEALEFCLEHKGEPVAAPAKAADASDAEEEAADAADAGEKAEAAEAAAAEGGASPAKEAEPAAEGGGDDAAAAAPAEDKPEPAEDKPEAMEEDAPAAEQPAAAEEADKKDEEQQPAEEPAAAAAAEPEPEAAKEEAAPPAEPAPAAEAAAPEAAAPAEPAAEPPAEPPAAEPAAAAAEEPAKPEEPAAAEPAA